MRKLYFLKTMLLLCALVAGTLAASAIETATATITASALDLGTSYPSSSTEKNIGGFTYVYADLMKSSDNIQAKASSGVIYNKTAYPGYIQSVAITHSGTARSTEILGSNNGTDWTSVKSGSGSITGDFSNKKYKYFKITRGSNAAYWTQVVVTYETSTAPEDTRTEAASIGDLNISELPYNATGTFSATITPATGVGTNYSVAWSIVSKNNSLTLQSNGDYDAGTTKGDAEIKVTVTPTDETTYKPVSKSFTVNVYNPAEVVFTFSENYGQTFLTDGYAESAFEYTGKAVAIKVEGRYRFWNSDKTLRLYKKDANDATTSNAVLTLTAPANKVITNVVFSNSAAALTPNHGTVTTTVWNGSASKVVLTHDGNSGSVTLKSITVTYGDYETISIGPAGYATYASDNDLDFSLVDNLKAYKATVSGTTITFEKVTTVPAGEGVLLQGATGDYQVPVVTDVDDWANADNAFVRGNDEAVATGEGPYNYILNNVGGVVGFYKAAGQTVAKNRAYLQSATNAARITLDFDDSNGISSIQIAEGTTNDEVYNLQGQRVAQPTRGLFIVNGKKVIKN